METRCFWVMLCHTNFGGTYFLHLQGKYDTSTAIAGAARSAQQSYPLIIIKKQKSVHVKFSLLGYGQNIN